MAVTMTIPSFRRTFPIVRRFKDARTMQLMDHSRISTSSEKSLTAILGIATYTEPSILERTDQTPTFVRFTDTLSSQTQQVHPGRQ